jgi:hypothetical protein
MTHFAPTGNAYPYPQFTPKLFHKQLHSAMQTFPIMLLFPIVSATPGAAAAIPDFDFLPNWDWILGEPTVLDPVEQDLEEQLLHEEYLYNLDQVHPHLLELDPLIFVEATLPDPGFIGPVLLDPSLLDLNSLDPALADPNDPYVPEMSRTRPNCGTNIFGPNVPLCCNGIMSPGGIVVSGCQYHDPGKKICKNKDNVVCCQYMVDGVGYACWRYY